ncbi:hypothetical protein QQZ08_011701 [Neonectria magnoliae]|uniref:Velvet domain-containing protein n=1 Tax=Neonectria magnoliae TaxID=2732573 RepID=A0ABR1H7Y7_9HYPO
MHADFESFLSIIVPEYQKTTAGLTQHQQQALSMPTLSIAVQPPRETQVGQIIYPPVIGNLVCRRPHERYYFFAMVVLLGVDGTVIDGGFAGTTVSTGTPLAGADSSRHSVVFVFPDISISYEGTYKIRMDVYKVAYEDPDKATLNTQVETRSISIVSEEVARKRPSDREHEFMRSLRHAGIPIP